MPEYHRMRDPGGTYFFTVNLLNRRRKLLTDHVNFLHDAFDAVQSKRPIQVDAFVILPEHLHCIWTLPPGDDAYDVRWNQIKGEFSKQLPKVESISRSRIKKRERGIWQRRYWEHTIDGDYIHYNPVKHGHVSRPADWKHSSIHQYIKDGILAPDWAAGKNPIENEENTDFGE